MNAMLIAIAAGGDSAITLRSMRYELAPYQ
jgi:hypothetical protein